MKLGKLIKVGSLLIILVILPIIGGKVVNTPVETLPVSDQNKVLYSQNENLFRDHSTVTVMEISGINQEPNPAPKLEPKTSPVTTKPQITNQTPAQNLVESIGCRGTLSQEFQCLLNEYRESKGLASVSFDTGLAQVAKTHSEWMYESGIFSHTGINGSRLTERCAAAGIRCLAENLAHNILTAQKLLDSWKANPGHNKNLLGPYNTIGLGVFDKYVTLLMN